MTKHELFELLLTSLKDEVIEVGGGYEGVVVSRVRATEAVLSTLGNLISGCVTYGNEICFKVVDFNDDPVIFDSVVEAKSATATLMKQIKNAIQRVSIDETGKEIDEVKGVSAINIIN